MATSLSMSNLTGEGAFAPHCTATGTRCSFVVAAAAVGAAVVDGAVVAVQEGTEEGIFSDAERLRVEEGIEGREAEEEEAEEALALARAAVAAAAAGVVEERTIWELVVSRAVVAVVAAAVAGPLASGTGQAGQYDWWTRRRCLQIEPETVQILISILLSLPGALHAIKCLRNSWSYGGLGNI